MDRLLLPAQTGARAKGHVAAGGSGAPLMRRADEGHFKTLDYCSNSAVNRAVLRNTMRY